ncbi:hypothetical protein SAMN04488128_103912 [Chitinophaga eiseniae]|uniref:Uncharacterized protein n=1 Tax=Chitinophaga eiseniae TaxID=634771 RepID=A0A1T4T0B3_9BACT|nr:hypothetical protein [Chitinophaga eiseniae]SKA33893.1 hypothetical protein SAMN04488128_103912 [Chitinophaga eiseniae]
MPAKEKKTGSDRSNEHKKVTDETMHPLDPHDKQRVTQQKRAEEDIPEQTFIDDEELAGDEPLTDDL